MARTFKQKCFMLGGRLGASYIRLPLKRIKYENKECRNLVTINYNMQK
jgi:hypothetical protein